MCTTDFMGEVSMGVYIKSMEMPTSCFYCPFRRKINPDDIQCLVTRDVFEETFAGTIEMRNRGFCPLVEIPPHGRLIDADALLKLIDSCMFPSDMVTTRAVSMATNWIKEAPTVTTADKDGEA